MYSSFCQRLSHAGALLLGQRIFPSVGGLVMQRHCRSVSGVAAYSQRRSRLYSQRRCRAALPHIAGPACFLPSSAQPLSQRRCRAALPHIAGPACFLPSAAQPLSQRRCRAALPHILHDLINSVLCLLQPFWFHGVGSRAASCLITNMFMTLAMNILSRFQIFQFQT